MHTTLQFYSSLRQDKQSNLLYVNENELNEVQHFLIFKHYTYMISLLDARQDTNNFGSPDNVTQRTK